jgi:hypothetical protein
MEGRGAGREHHRCSATGDAGGEFRGGAGVCGNGGGAVEEASGEGAVKGARRISGRQGIFPAPPFNPDTPSTFLYPLSRRLRGKPGEFEPPV